MKDNYQMAIEVLAGLYGNGAERRNKLESLGYDYMAVQSIVNSLVRDGMTGEQALARLNEVEELSIKSGEYLIIDYDVSLYKGIVINIKM